MPKPANKPVIALDIDDVLAEHFDVLEKHFKDKHGIQMKHSDMLTGLLSSSRIDPMNHEKLITGVEELFASPVFYTEPLPGAVHAINILKKDYELVSITGRPLSIKNLTIDWLQKYFGNAFKSVDFVGGEKWGSGIGASKTHLLSEYQAAFLVDDSLSHCLKAADGGIESLLFGEYKWNETDERLPLNVTRVKNWQEVLEYFENEKG
jgi:5'(3')-deoxyribonucleotidase